MLSRAQVFRKAAWQFREAGEEDYTCHAISRIDESGKASKLWGALHRGKYKPNSSRAGDLWFWRLLPKSDRQQRNFRRRMLLEAALCLEAQGFEAPNA